VQLAYLWRPALPDVDDDMVLEAAVNGRAGARLALGSVVRHAQTAMRVNAFAPKLQTLGV
jgi:hypothetical protein